MQGILFYQWLLGVFDQLCSRRTHGLIYSSSFKGLIVSVSVPRFPLCPDAIFYLLGTNPPRVETVNSIFIRGHMSFLAPHDFYRAGLIRSYTTPLTFSSPFAKARSMLNSMIYNEGEAIRPPIVGVKLAIYVTSVFFIAVSVVVVSLRVYVRWNEKSFWWDDATMSAALIIYNVTIGLSCRSVYLGLGTHRMDLTESQEREARKFLAVWLPLYAACLVLVKGSICITMLRLTQTMKYTRWSIYLLLWLCICAFIISIVGSASSCRPFAANWDLRLITEGKGSCSPVSAVLGISYTSTAITIATDIGCAILPGVILWKTQLKLKVKLSVGLLLSFGSFASVCTMIRAPYVKYYMDDDLIYWLANLVLWSNIENGVGLIAGSIPVLQKIIMRRFKKEHSSSTPNSVGLVTFGSAPAKSRNRRVFSNPTDVGFSVTTVQTNHHPHDWERLEDDTSSQGIRADFTYEVERSQASEANLVVRGQ
ncbi:hypothetical protein F4805DRAFT_47782 [Annulohypoxylon moriforme]|nr:hypothetical protein F4805DRAFT_47782 [Annulohypoxylon moriforme]